MPKNRSSKREGHRFITWPRSHKWSRSLTGMKSSKSWARKAVRVHRRHRVILCRVRQDEVWSFRTEDGGAVHTSARVGARYPNLPWLLPCSFFDSSWPNRHLIPLCGLFRPRLLQFELLGHWQGILSSSIFEGPSDFSHITETCAQEKRVRFDEGQSRESARSSDKFHPDSPELL